MVDFWPATIIGKCIQRVLSLSSKIKKIYIYCWPKSRKGCAKGPHVARGTQVANPCPRQMTA